MAKKECVGNNIFFKAERDCFVCGKENGRGIIIAKIYNPVTKITEYVATSSCDCQKQELNARDETFWTVDMTKELIKAWASGRSKKEYSEDMNKLFGIDAGKSRKEKYEWRSPSTKKIENIRSAQLPAAWHKIFDYKNISDETVEKSAISAFNNRLKQNPNTWSGFGRTADPENKKNKTLKDYDSTPCLCKHEKGAHSNGYCPVCKKHCW